jgi:hypothetical protein
MLMTVTTGAMTGLSAIRARIQTANLVSRWRFGDLAKMENEKDKLEEEEEKYDVVLRDR